MQSGVEASPVLRFLIGFREGEELVKELDLKAAISQINQACAGKRWPFFFLVGAGVSKPPILLASEIEAECRQKAREFGRGDEPSGKGAMDTYSHWSDRAFPQPGERQEYLRTLIEGKPISHANFRLAHILLSEKITNLVVTTNFDDFLSRALTLFGKQHIICDHPKTVDRVSLDRPDIQIVHVHGTYWFYDCCNLRGEIEERSQATSETAFTMASLLDEILRHRSPLVVGYSGWEGDVVMTALSRRLQGRLPYNLYWFCYRKDDWRSLPDWLLGHPNAYMVLPEVQTAGRSETAEKYEAEGGPGAQLPSRTGVPTSALAGKGSKAPTLSAQDVFDALIQAFQLEPPKLTTDPLDFFVKQLDCTVPKDQPGGPAADTYRISDVIHWIESLNEKEKFDSPLRGVRDALRRSQYCEAIREGLRIYGGTSDLGEGELLMLMRDVAWALQRLNDPCDIDLEAHDLVIKIANALLEKKPGEAVLQEQLAKTLNDKGLALDRRGKEEEQIEVYDEVVRRFKDTREPGVRKQVVRAWVNKATTLHELDRALEALAAYAEVIPRFEAIRDPALDERLAAAFLNRSLLLSQLKRTDESLDSYDQLVKRFGDSKETEVREHVSAGLNNVAFHMLCDAKKARASGDEPSATACLEQAWEKISAALQRKLDDPVMLGNQAYIAFLRGNKQEAARLLTCAISLGDEETRQAELSDSTITPLPEDEEFRQLVRSVPGQPSSPSPQPKAP